MRPKKPLERAWTQPDLLLIAALMVAVTLLYVAGVAAERAPCASTGSRSSPQAAAWVGAILRSSAPCAGQETGGGQDHDAAAGAAASPETVLGVPVEDPGIVTAIVVSWLLLAAVVVSLGRPILPSLVLIAGGAVLFDGAEVIRQLTEARYGIAALASLVTLGHLAILVLVALALTRNGPQRITATLHKGAARLLTVWQLLPRRDRA